MISPSTPSLTCLHVSTWQAGEDPGEPPLLPHVARPTPRLPGSTRDSNVFSPIALPSYLSSIADPGTSAPTPHSKAGPVSQSVDAKHRTRGSQSRRIANRHCALLDGMQPPLLSPKSGGGPPTDFATASGDVSAAWFSEPTTVLPTLARIPLM